MSFNFLILFKSNISINDLTNFLFSLVIIKSAVKANGKVNPSDELVSYEEIEMTEDTQENAELEPAAESEEA